jgi:phosphoglycerate dehydrogenase-like enzyme
MTDITVLDDYQNVALSVADWSILGLESHVRSITERVNDPVELAARIGASDVLVLNRERTAVTAELLDRCSRLKLIVTLGMRNPVIDLAAARARDITVCGTRMLGYPTAELTWALITAMARDITGSAGALRDGYWQSGPLGVDLNGQALGVAGFGRIGQAVARVGVAFGMDVLVHSRSVTQEDAATIGATAVGKDELISRSDVLTLHVPLTPATRGFIGARELAACKSSLLLVNTSRGPIIDKAAVIEALLRGRIAGLGMDVFDTEPLPAGDPLLKAPNALLTPHLGYVTEKNYRQAFAGVIEDIAAWQQGSPVREISG